MFTQCIPFLETDTTPDMDEISCRDVMHKPVVVLQQEDTLENMIQVWASFLLGVVVLLDPAASSLFLILSLSVCLSVSFSTNFEIPHPPWPSL